MRRRLLLPLTVAWLTAMGSVSAADSPRQRTRIAFATPPGGLRRLFGEAQAGRRWLTLRSTTQAASWQRSVFNGHAQVILQSTGTAGRATLRAIGERLEAAAVTLDAH